MERSSGLPTLINNQPHPSRVLLDMDMQVQRANCVRSPTSISPSILLKDQKFVSSPTAEKASARAKLPPLTMEATCDSHPKGAVLKKAKEEVQSIMKLLLVEVTKLSLDQFNFKPLYWESTVACICH